MLLGIKNRSRLQRLHQIIKCLLQFYVKGIFCFIPDKLFAKDFNPINSYFSSIAILLKTQKLHSSVTFLPNFFIIFITVKGDLKP